MTLTPLHSETRSSNRIRCLAPQDISPGDNWAREIARALEKAEAVVLLLSPDAVASDLVRQEIEFAISSPRFKNRLIPILVRPTSEVSWILKELPQWLEAPDPLIAARSIAEVLETPQTNVSAKAATAARRRSRTDLAKMIAVGTDLTLGKVNEVLEAIDALVAADLVRQGRGLTKLKKETVRTRSGLDFPAYRRALCLQAYGMPFACVPLLRSERRHGGGIWSNSRVSISSTCLLGLRWYRQIPKVKLQRRKQVRLNKNEPC
jgi:hypothetical protein